MTFRNLLTSREGPSLARIAPFALSSLISASVGLASLAAFTRILLPSQVGQYVALLAFIVLFQSVGFFWLQNGLLRAYSKCRDDVAKAHLVSATKMGFALASAMVSAAWLGFAFFSGRILPIELWLVGLPLLLLGGWTAITRSWLRVSARPWRFVTAETVQSLGGFVLSLSALLLLGANPVLIIAGGIIAALLAAALSFDLLRKPFAAALPTRAALHQLWRYGAPLTLIGFLTSVMAVSDRILIVALVDAPSAGAFGVGYSIADRAVMLVLVPITFAMKPIIFASFESGDHLRTQALLLQSARWLMAIGLPVTTLLVIAPAPLVGLFAGASLAGEAQTVVPWVAIGSLLGALLSLHFGLAFQLADRTSAMFAVLAPATAFNLLANVLLLPTFGLIAAAWTTTATYGFALILSAIVGRRYYPIPFPVRDTLICAAACIPLAAVLGWAPQATVLAYFVVAALGGLAYLVTLALLAFLFGSASAPDKVVHPASERLR